MEANNIWLFDFDGCRYAHYLYDVASFMLDCLMNGYLAEVDARTCLYEKIMPYFRIGYELHRNADESFFKDLELFIAYRAMTAMANLLSIRTCGEVDELEEIRNMFFEMLSAPDILAALTNIRRSALTEKKE